MPFPRHLLEGYSAFRAGRLHIEQDRYRDLAEAGQSPEVMVIGCCDSRVSPEVIFNARPGELFVVRNVANLVPPYTPDGAQRAVSAALEFAVQALKVKHIVVLGHAHCGGIRAYAEPGSPLSPGDFIGRWMELIAPAAAAVGAASALLVTRELFGASGAGLDRQNARQPDDVSVRPHSGRAQEAFVARRVFRCRDRRALRARSRVRRIRPGQDSVAVRLPSASPGSACD